MADFPHPGVAGDCEKLVRNWGSIYVAIFSTDTILLCTHQFNYSHQCRRQLVNCKSFLVWKGLRKETDWLTYFLPLARLWLWSSEIIPFQNNLPRQTKINVTSLCGEKCTGGVRPQCAPLLASLKTWQKRKNALGQIVMKMYSNKWKSYWLLMLTSSTWPHKPLTLLHTCFRNANGSRSLARGESNWS